MQIRKIVLLATTTLSIAVLPGCGVGEARTNSSVTEVSSPLPVEVVIPRRAEISASYHTTSTISADSDAPAIARVDGEVVEIFVEEGDLVEQGQVLARLDGDRLRLEMQQAKANLEKTTREYERFVNLHERGLVSTAAIDDMKFEMNALRASYGLKRLNHGYTYIRAPISGVVATRDVKIGQHTRSGQATFRIADTGKLVAYLRIPQSELSKFTAGQNAEVRVDAMPEQLFTAMIARISPTIDTANGTFRATAYVDNSDGQLAPGMFGRFRISYEKHADALLIPKDAVTEEDNVAVVYIVEDGAAVRITIETGFEEKGNIEVLSGLQGGEHVIVTGQNGLREGSKVLASVPGRVPSIG